MTRTIRTGCAFVALLILSSTGRLFAVSLDSGGTGPSITCALPTLTGHSFSKSSRGYFFQGECQYSQGDSASNLPYSISAQWDVGAKTAKESIQGLLVLGGNKHTILLSASCTDDPWLTNAACTLIALLDNAGASVPPQFSQPPFPKSRGGVPAAQKPALLTEAANAPDKKVPAPPPPPLPPAPAPTIVSPAAGHVFPGSVDLVVVKSPKQIPGYSPNFEYMVEWFDPKSQKWHDESFFGSWVSLSKGGHTTIPHSEFKTVGKWRLKARTAILPLTNVWTDWREFSVVAPFPAAAGAAR